MQSAGTSDTDVIKNEGQELRLKESCPVQTAQKQE